MSGVTPTADRLVLLSGATGSGKTALAVALAHSLGGELVGADSVQIYRRLDVGSAKPTAEELGGVPHHLLDVADLDEPFDAGRYVSLADEAIRTIRGRGRVPIVVGGTGLYLRALVYGLAPGIPSDASVRAGLNARAAAPGELARMYEELARVDPAYAAKIHPTDPIRVVRALEVHALSGEPLSAHHARHAAMAPRYDALFLALDVSRDELRAKLATRTDAMAARGWADEVRAILRDGYDPELKPLRAVGYAEMVRHIREDISWEDTRDAIARSTAAYAKRQRTWLRGERAVTWLTPDELRTPAWFERVRAWAKP